MIEPIKAGDTVLVMRGEHHGRRGRVLSLATLLDAMDEPRQYARVHLAPGGPDVEISIWDVHRLFGAMAREEQERRKPMPPGGWPT